MKPYIDFSEFLFACFAVSGEGIARKNGQLPGPFQVAARILQSSREREASVRQDHCSARILLGKRKRPLKQCNALLRGVELDVFPSDECQWLRKFRILGAERRFKNAQGAAKKFKSFVVLTFKTET